MYLPDDKSVLQRTRGIIGSVFANEAKAGSIEFQRVYEDRELPSYDLATVHTDHDEPNGKLTVLLQDELVHYFMSDMLIADEDQPIVELYAGAVALSSYLIRRNFALHPAFEPLEVHDEMDHYLRDRSRITGELQQFLPIEAFTDHASINRRYQKVDDVDLRRGPSVSMVNALNMQRLSARVALEAAASANSSSGDRLVALQKHMYDMFAAGFCGVSVDARNLSEQFGLPEGNTNTLDASYEHYICQLGLGMILPVTRAEIFSLRNVLTNAQELAALAAQVDEVYRNDPDKQASTEFSAVLTDETATVIIPPDFLPPGY